MFVSNSDNLGATLDLALLTHFAESGSSFMMECAERTEADKKGGHLAVRAADGQLILRESAQCAKEDEAAFQDVTKCVPCRVCFFLLRLGDAVVIKMNPSSQSCERSPYTT